ncbi:MAG TPA: hypothetical protein VGC74_10245 [Stenotrophomonas sp.]|jgi:hypothetical protein
MNIAKGAIAFMFAAFVPALIFLTTAIVGPSPAGVADLAFGFVVWYLVTIPIVFVIGFMTLPLASKTKLASILLPPVVGGASGLIIANVLYAQGANAQGLFLFFLCGVATAVVASLIYFSTTRKLDPHG